MKGSGTADNMAKTALGGEAGMGAGWKERQEQEHDGRKGRNRSRVEGNCRGLIHKFQLIT